MADKRKSDTDEPITSSSDEQIRGVSGDDEFEDTDDDLDEDDAEDEEGSSTF